MDSQDLSSNQVDVKQMTNLRRTMASITAQTSQTFQDDNGPTMSVVMEKLQEWGDQAIRIRVDVFETALASSLQLIVLTSGIDGNCDVRLSKLNEEIEKTMELIPDHPDLAHSPEDIAQNRELKLRLTNLVNLLLRGLYFVVKEGDQPVANKQPDSWSAEASRDLLVVLDGMAATPPKVSFKSGNATAAWTMCSSAFYNGVALWQSQFAIRFIQKYGPQFAASKLFLDPDSYLQNPLLDATANLSELGDIFKGGIGNAARIASSLSCSYYESHPGGVWAPRAVSGGSGGQYELTHAFTAMIAPIFWKVYEPFVALACDKDKVLAMDAPDYNVKVLLAQKVKMTETRLEPILLSLSILCHSLKVHHIKLIVQPTFN